MQCLEQLAMPMQPSWRQAAKRQTLHIDQAKEIYTARSTSSMLDDRRHGRVPHDTLKHGKRMTRGLGGAQTSSSSHAWRSGDVRRRRWAHEPSGDASCRRRPPRRLGCKPISAHLPALAHSAVVMGCASGPRISSVAPQGHRMGIRHPSSRPEPALIGTNFDCVPTQNPHPTGAPQDEVVSS